MVVLLDPSLPSQGIPDDDVIDALTNGIVRITRRVEIYEADAVTPFNVVRWDGRLVDGSVNVDRTRDERRILDLSLDNNDKLLRVDDPNNGFWYDKILKVFWGIRFFDGTSNDERRYETQIGEFMIDTIAETRFPRVVRVTGRDYSKKCMKSKIKSSVQFSQYTTIETIIAALAANAGITKIALPFTGQSYARDVVFEQGTPRWKVMTELADSIGYELYFTGNGYLTMRPYGDPVMSPVSFVFQTGPNDGTLVRYERSANDSRIFNHIIVTGAAITNLSGITETVFAESRNDDPASPTRIARIGDRVDPIKSDYITNQYQAQQLADARLRIGSLEEYEVNFDSVIIPWLDAGDIVDVIDDTAVPYVPQRFLLSSFNFPLSLTSMACVARRVTIIGTNNTLEYQ